MRRALAVVASCIFVSVFANMVQADTFTWGVNSGSWSSGPNWGGSAPLISATNSFFFGDNGVTAWTSTNDIAGTMPVNILTFAGNTGGTLSSTVASNVLSFTSSSATNPSILMTGTGTVTLASTMSVAKPLTITLNAGAGTLTLGTASSPTGNWLTGNQALTIVNNSSNPLVLYGSNAYTGAVTIGPSPLTVASPGIQLNSANALANSVITLTETSTTNFPIAIGFGAGVPTFNIAQVTGNANSMVNMLDPSGNGINLQVGGNNATWMPIAGSTASPAP